MLVEFLAVLLHHALDVALVESHCLSLFEVGEDETHEFVATLHDKTLAHHSHRVEFVLNLLGINVLPVGAEQHVLYASADEDVSVCRHGGEVAGVIPSFGIESLACGFLVLVVAEHDVGASCHNLAGDILGVGTEYLHLHVAYGSAARAGLEVVPVAIGDERGALGGSISGGDGEVDALEECLYLLIEGCTASHHLVGIAAKGLHHHLTDALLHLLVDDGHVPQQSHFVVLYLREHHLADNLLHHERHGDDNGRMDVGKGLCNDSR